MLSAIRPPSARLVAVALLLTAGGAAAVTSDPIRSVDDVPPAPVTDIRALNAGTNILVTWTPSADDGLSYSVFDGTIVPGANVHGYRVYRGRQGGQPELVATLAAGTRDYVDTSPLTGVTYVYAVVAFDADNEALPAIEPGSAADLARIAVLGGGAPDVVVTRSVKARMVFDIAVDLTDATAVDAFKADFVELIAGLLGIAPARIRVTGVTQGSTVVAFEIVDVEGDTGPSAEDALVDLLARVADDTEDEFASLAPVLDLVDESEDLIIVIPQPLDPLGNIVRSWFSRQGTQVGLADFFLFADRFGTRQGDTGFDARFDIVSDGAVELSDFFVFADEYGRDIANAAEIQALIGQ